MSLHVLRPGPLATLQDRGRPGLAHLGVPRAGPLDAPAAALANRLVGNDPDAALVEATFGGLELRTDAGAWVAVTGAPVPVAVDGSPRGHACAQWLPAGATLRLGVPATGVRSYVAVAGGVDVAPVLGSRSTDTLAWVGPPRLKAGTVLPVGLAARRPAPHDTPRPPEPGPLRVHAGPRADWFAAGALAALCRAPYVVGEASDRVGLRLEGPVLDRVRAEELPSEGMVLGAVQVPPSGQPVVLLADHPPTGGYPVLAVVEEADLWRCAQLRPGDEVRFRRA
ncbi:biotin-dependent carboxyltransferase family protein [Nocardioides sp. cx-173]|uniref:5-oxoprolinase subunit C family protein n=1 Tax=Nocardioides sp. cx-173 TaxID=2898796 RepID=UPI001E2D18E0|nr:biotin-dependent carboxyltransferase family protein [Nocardioides sp. cx-173]MCD4527294.1 biotin-dependent carboxyltransferase family protein [Nocardioides sp. cx-173]UGB43594.1 biotin-dependent carboxyltransferase family protein [Nocardioides sp. cx-173]